MSSLASEGPAKRASAKKLLPEAEARKLLARHHGSHFDPRRTEPLIMPDVHRFGPKTPNWGCGACGTDGNWASRTVCRHCGKTAPYRSRAAAKQAIAKLEEQLKAAKNENKRLAAKVQQSGKERDTEVEPEDARDEEEGPNLDELQTLVDLSSKYFTDSVHNATLRAKLDAERKKKQDAKPVQAQISICRDGWRRSAKAAVDQKIIEMRKQLENEEASAAVLAVDIDELEKELQMLQRRAMLTGAATTTCGDGRKT